MSLLLKAIEVDSASVSFYKNRGSNVVLKNDARSSESSSIGAADESSLDSSSSAVEGEEEEVESKMRRDSFCSLDSLEDSLPSKRGLSNFFNGKSKSFATLSDVVTAPLTAADLEKPEHPFNKKRRILMANRARWPRHASCGSLSSVVAAEEATSLPPHQNVEYSAANLFSLEEDDEEEEEEEEEEDGDDDENSDQGGETAQEEEDSFHSPSFSQQLRKLKTRRNNLPSFRSPRSFSVGDLQQHHADLFC